jgi:N-methylhydantoinase A
LLQRIDAFDAQAINATMKYLEEQAGNCVDKGAERAETTTKLTAFMGYAGQRWEIPVLLDYVIFAQENASVIKFSFEAAYQTLFGRPIEGLTIEITNWSLTVGSMLPDASAATRHDSGADVTALRTRQFYGAALRRMADAQEVDRDVMTAEQAAEGPAVIVETETITIVTSTFRAIGQGDGRLLLRGKQIV